MRAGVCYMEGCALNCFHYRLSSLLGLTIQTVVSLVERIAIKLGQRKYPKSPRRSFSGARWELSEELGKQCRRIVQR